MGRIFEKRKHKMFARWAKNAKAFTKVGKEIAIAIRLGGGDPNGNPRLRMAMKVAQSLNMPKDRIEAAIKRATSKDVESLEEVTYEAYGPNGVALVIECATNNPTRTVANIRAILGHNDGSLATSGALDFMFQRRGVFTIDAPTDGLDELELDLIDHGLEDIFDSDDGLLLFSTFENYGEMQRALESKKVEVKAASLQRFPTSQVALTKEEESQIEELISALEEDDDVQNVYHNMKAAD